MYYYIVPSPNQVDLKSCCAKFPLTSKSRKCVVLQRQLLKEVDLIVPVCYSR